MILFISYNYQFIDGYIEQPCSILQHFFSKQFLKTQDWKSSFRCIQFALADEPLSWRKCNTFASEVCVAFQDRWPLIRVASLKVLYI